MLVDLIDHLVFKSFHVKLLNHCLDYWESISVLGELLKVLSEYVIYLLEVWINVGKLQKLNEDMIRVLVISKL